MIATLSGHCPICKGRIIKGRSRIERTLTGWAHEACADSDSSQQRAVRRRAGRALKSYRRPYKD